MMTFAELPQTSNFRSMLDGDLLEVTLEEFWMLPVRLAEMAYGWQLEMGQFYTNLFSPAWHMHPHAARYQLEVPDPIVEASEQDLFA